jgi:hypothetical protein
MDECKTDKLPAITDARQRLEAQIVRNKELVTKIGSRLLCVMNGCGADQVTGPKAQKPHTCDLADSFNAYADDLCVSNDMLSDFLSRLEL